jgi:hypothetical protein
LQNLLAGALSTPHAGHLRISGAPHSLQNFASDEAER